VKTLLKPNDNLYLGYRRVFCISLPFPVSQPTDPRSQDRLITGQRKTVSAKTKNRKSEPENQSQAKRKTQLMAHLGTIKRKIASNKQFGAVLTKRQRHEKEK